MDLRGLGRLLFIAGAFLVCLGAALYFLGKLPLKLGNLPGDITIRGRHGTFYFPWVTCLLLSALLSLLSWAFHIFRR